jgi:hypothetical protein
MLPPARWGIFVALASTACPGPAECTEDLPACVELPFDPGSCAPLYPPTFDDVFDQTLSDSCAPQGSYCHSTPGSSGADAHDLVFADADQAYEALMGDVDGRPFVDPSTPECSVLLVRLATDNDCLRMPKGETPLGAAELCAIARWIDEGADR